MSVGLWLVGLTALCRLAELGISRARRRALVARGAALVPELGFVLMVAVHISVLAGSLVEPMVAGRRVPLGLCATAVSGVALANLLRIWAILTLGRHWNVRVVSSTFLGVVETGPYRFIRHPNYVAVFLELLLVPVAVGAWLTAAFGSCLHLLVLSKRIALEESVLLADPAYLRRMGPKPRFFPWSAA